VSRSFFDLRNEINLFLEIEEKNVSNIKRTRRILVLAFMVNITKHLNELNLNLQRKNKLVTSIYDNVKAFQTKLWQWKSQLKTGNLLHFKTCESISVLHELQLLISD
jgi:hypothetical protein